MEDLYDFLSDPHIVQLCATVGIVLCLFLLGFSIANRRSGR